MPGKYNAHFFPLAKFAVEGAKSDFNTNIIIFRCLMANEKVASLLFLSYSTYIEPPKPLLSTMRCLDREEEGGRGRRGGHGGEIRGGVQGTGRNLIIYQSFL